MEIIKHLFGPINVVDLGLYPLHEVEQAYTSIQSFQMKYCQWLKDITKALQSLTSIKEMRVRKCPIWESSIWTDRDTWQLLEGHHIKLTIHSYTVSWALDQVTNSRFTDNFKWREKLRRSFLVCRTPVLFKEASTSSTAGVVEQRTLQNDSA